MKTRSPLYGRTFGVLEIILSVGILAIFALPVLQLFVRAAAEEKQARMTDTAVAAAISYVEQFKSGSTPFSLSDTLGGAPDTAGQSYQRQVGLGSGVTATVDIRHDGETDGGGLYAIHVAVSGEGVRGTLYQLDGLAYFAR